MFDKLAHHIPDDYESRPIEGATMWVGAADTNSAATSMIQRLAEEAVAAVSGLLEFRKPATGCLSPRGRELV